jgi:RimJ/RimL family protein N-acetyltransferase
MSAKRPEPRVLEGRFIRLIPMTVDDLPELERAIAHPSVFQRGYGGGPAGYRDAAAGFAEWARGYYEWESGIPFIARAIGGELDGTVVGTSTLGDFVEAREHAHIGWTAWDPRVWGSQVNPEAKLLMLEYAFGAGFGRVKIQTDEVNDRSRAAIAGIGATFEGIVRRDSLKPNGVWRNSAVYSIIIDDWPDVRAGLRARLERWQGEPVEYRDKYGQDAAASSPA